MAYLKTGLCPRTACKFLHPEGEEVARAREEQEEVARARREETEEQKRERQVGREDKGQRAKVFADWLVSVWGLARLERGLVLDIAGGRGDLAFELARRGLDCATVDPRPPKLKRWQAKFRKKHPEVKVPEHYQDYFSEDFLSSRAIPSSSVSLVVGLHPDEATEPLVSAALALGIDFCVIPCCVFSASFPHRRMEDGSGVSSYQHFCKFLGQKDPRIQEEDLQFEGKNKVLYLKTEQEPDPVEPCS